KNYSDETYPDDNNNSEVLAEDNRLSSIPGICKVQTQYQQVVNISYCKRNRSKAKHRYHDYKIGGSRISLNSQPISGNLKTGFTSIEWMSEHCVCQYRNADRGRKYPK